ncbi:MAG: hypothetical protein ACP5OO_11500 [Chloroflexia bacterium]
MGRVLTTLQRRQEIQDALEDLARARTEGESRALLNVLGAHGLAVLPIALRYLDTPDPWMVRALGRTLAQISERERVVEALRRAILSPESSVRRRIVALVLLDQFLEEPADPALFNVLGNPTEVAVQALLEETPEEAYLTRLDYLSILHTQPPPEILYAIGRFREAANPPAVEALRFLALDERESIARPALEALGKIRRPEALQALEVIRPNVPPARQDLVERMRRKLILGGVPERPLPPPPPGGRILVSPPDGNGNRLILVMDGAGPRALHLFLSDRQGIEGAYEMVYRPGELPPAGPRGSVYPAPHPWTGLYLLEASWAYAQHLVSEALVGNEAYGLPCPLEYRFYCGRIWGYAEKEESPALPHLPGILSHEAVSLFLAHPYLASWFLESEKVEAVVQNLLRANLAHPEDQERLTLAVIALIQSEFSPEVCLRYARRLRDMAGWLARAREGVLAAIAAAAAEEMDRVPPLRSTFAVLLAQKGLLVALENRQASDAPDS